MISLLICLINSFVIVHVSAIAIFLTAYGSLQEIYFVGYSYTYVQTSYKLTVLQFYGNVTAKN